MQLDFKDKLLNQYFVPDFVSFNNITLELKAVSRLPNDEPISLIIYHLSRLTFSNCLCLLILVISPRSNTKYSGTRKVTDR